jgi:hypothetical protein
MITIHAPTRDDRWTETELKRNEDFRKCPILAAFISTMLEDLDLHESEEACMEEREARDSGTIYELADSEYEKCKAMCERFYSENLADIEAAGELEPGEPGLQYTQSRYMDADRIGSTFYMLLVGHGVAFTDDGDADCLQRLNDATRDFGHFEGAYFGDDGKVYTI